MNEWTVFLILGELIAFVIAVGTPILKLNTTITKLNDSINTLDKSFKETSKKNEESHKRIWSVMDEHADAINDHETRLVLIEKGGK